jgi:hypothetical protein
MKKFSIGLLALVLALGQAPAWAIVCEQRCMPQASLDCLRACAKSEALLTDNGALPNIGRACGHVEASFAVPGLTTASPSLSLPVLAVTGLAPLAGPSSALSVQAARAHSPPLPSPSQIDLSVPLAQAPPAALLFV